MPKEEQPSPADYATTLDKTSDDDLVAAVAGRGHGLLSATGAFDELYQRYSKTLMAFLKARTSGRETEDLYQEVWLRVWRQAGSFQGGNFRAWLFQIARSRVIDWQRKKRPQISPDLEQRVMPSDSPLEPLLHMERQAALRECLKQLDARAAELVRARLGGQSYEDVCLLLGLTSANAHKIFHKAKNRLNRCVRARLEA